MDKLRAALGWARANWKTLSALLTIIAATAGVTVAISDTNGDGSPDTVVIHRAVLVAPPATAVDGPDADKKRDDALSLDASAQQTLETAAKAPSKFDLGGDMRGADATKAGVIRGPLASQEWPGCKTAFVRSFSSRTSPIRAIALHYTAGLNTAGWGDVDGLTAFSNNVANQVSWHFAIDREGHCAYNVPITQKAWTISGLNSATVNLEIVGSGHEPDYAGTDGFRRVSSVVRRIARIEHIPVRLGATDGQCHVTQPGIITHWMGGPCSGGHVDIKPYDIVAVVKRIAADARPRVTVRAADREQCARFHRYRQRATHTPAGQRGYERHLAAFRARGLKCVAGKALVR